jgi:hypothetical protein
LPGHIYPKVYWGDGKQEEMEIEERGYHCGTILHALLKTLCNNKHWFAKKKECNGGTKKQNNQTIIIIIVIFTNIIIIIIIKLLFLLFLLS